MPIRFASEEITLAALVLTLFPRVAGVRNRRRWGPTGSLKEALHAKAELPLVDD
jgi:hypothetical protein